MTAAEHQGTVVEYGWYIDLNDRNVIQAEAGCSVPNYMLEMKDWILSPA